MISMIKSMIKDTLKSGHHVRFKISLGKQSTHANDKEDIEHRWAHDVPMPTLLWAQTPLWETWKPEPSPGSQGGPQPHHQRVSSSFFGDNSQRGNKELITDNGYGYEHVDHPNDVENDGRFSLLEGKDVSGVVSLGMICTILRHAFLRKSWLWRIISNLVI